MRIGLIQRDNVRSVLASSGTLFFMTRALEQHVGEVVELGPGKSLFTQFFLNAAKALNKISCRLFGRRISPAHLKLFSWQAARSLQKSIDAARVDVLFAPFASVEIANLKTRVPLIYHTDMTWADALGYYPVYTSLYSWAEQQGEQIQTGAFARSSAAIVPTRWVARSAVEHYGMAPENVSVAPYGANFNKEDLPSREAVIEPHIHPDIRLLWIGVDWARKGGKVAYECLLSLLDQGHNASLTICGCIPPTRFRHPRMTVVPFLSKQNAEQRTQLSKLFLESSFLIFPTVHEAAAIVLCEASAHGLPALATDTGGIACNLLHGVNGRLLPPNASGAEYATEVLSILSNPTAYREMLESSRRAFEDVLNWDAWGETARPLFERVAASANKAGAAS